MRLSWCILIWYGIEQQKKPPDNNLSEEEDESEKVHPTFSDGYLQVDIDYPGLKDIAVISNVCTWVDCSEKCRKTSQCRVWTWVSKTYWKPLQRHTCYLKKGREKGSKLEGVVSGRIGYFPRKDNVEVGCLKVEQLAKPLKSMHDLISGNK